jgi:hypothetical protein
MVNGEEKNHLKKFRQLKLIKRIILFLFIVLLIGLPVYFFRPLKKTVSLFPTEIESKTQLSCRIVAGTALFPLPNLENKPLERIKAEIYTGGSGISIVIGQKTLKLLTSTSVEHGMMEPLELKIVQNNEDSIISLAYEEALLGNGIVHSFILSKKTGFAVWTKSNSAFLYVKNPDAFVSYLQCY